MPRPNELHDELDALLDGRPVELTHDLAPLVEAADVLRAELAAYQLDPEVADRHLERVLEGSATVVRMPVRPQLNGWDLRLRMPVRPQPNGWDLRRRVASVVLAAALVLAPATMASAAALPGQAMYPFKLAIEQLRLASVQWSSTREAGERTRVADERLDELERLVEMKMYSQLPTAIDALSRAVVAARVAVSEAQRDGEPVPGVVAKLNRVNGDSRLVLGMVTTSLEEPVALLGSTRKAIQAAVDDSQEVLAQPKLVSPTPTTTPAPPPTSPPPTSPPPTEPPPPSPPSTEGSAETPASVGSQLATDGRLQAEVPPSTVASP
jgi:hypothetical protein